MSHLNQSKSYLANQDPLVECMPLAQEENHLFCPTDKELLSILIWQTIDTILADKETN